MATVAPPARTDIAGTPSNAVAKTAFGVLHDYLLNLLGSAGSPAAARTALGSTATGDALFTTATAATARTTLDVYSKSEVPIAPNLIDNSNFAINQRGVSGTVSLAAGAYGHDRWKAGSSGCTYTFATSAGITTITISAGSLVQVVDGANLETATYTLSHSGTAQVRVVAGSYAASPIAVSATGGTNLSLEFGTGTVKQVKLEKGSLTTPWQMPTGDDYFNCLRRAYVCGNDGVSNAVIALGDVDAGNLARTYFDFPVPMISVPSFVNLDAVGNFNVAYGDGGIGPAVTAFSAVYATKKLAVISATAAGLAAGNFTRLHANGSATARLLFSCDL